MMAHNTKQGSSLQVAHQSLITIDAGASTLAEIDSQLEITARVAIALKRRRNAVIAVSRLPADLFHRIFLFVRQGDGNVRSMGDGWIAVSQVCHYWRNLALSYPLLWNQIHMSYPQWASEMLQRSQSVPLIVHADLGIKLTSSLNFRHLISALSHITRIREVHVVLRPGNYHIATKIASTMITMSAPILESLSLSVIENKSTPVTPPTFLGGQILPSLRQLKLVEVELAQPIVCPHLKQLEIQHNHYRKPYTMDDLITFLQQTPLLTDLVLRNVLQFEGGEKEQYTGRPAELPHLLTFRLQGHMDILDHLVLPFNTALALHLFDWGFDLTDYRPFEEAFVVVAKRLNGEHNNEKIRHIQIGGNSDGEPTLRGWSGGVVGPPLVPSFEISTDWNQWEDGYKCKFYALLHYMCTHLPLAGIWILDIGPARRLNYYTTSMMLEVLMAFAGIHTLRTSGSSISDIFYKLADGLQGEDNREVVLPKLSTIILDSVDFGHASKTWEPEFWGGMLGLQDYLARRRKQNSPIERLEIRGSMNVTEERLRIVEMVVPEVWWDGELIIELDDDRADYEVSDEEEEESEGESQGY